MKKIQQIILAFMLGIMPLQSALADSKVDELVIAALSGDLKQVKTLIKQGVDINTKSIMGGTALMAASFEGHLEVVKYLISKGANVNVMAVASEKTEGIVNNFTALDSATKNERYKIVEVLKSAGAKSAKEITK